MHLLGLNLLVSWPEKHVKMIKLYIIANYLILEFHDIDKHVLSMPHNIDTTSTCTGVKHQHMLDTK
jgi:hypothetical protein